MEISDFREICESHLAYLLDKKFLLKVKGGGGFFTLTLCRPNNPDDSYDSYKIRDIECDLFPLHSLLSSMCELLSINLWILDEKNFLHRVTLPGLDDIEENYNFMEISINYEIID